MAKVLAFAEKKIGVEEKYVDHQQHPFAFHVSGPRNVATSNWREVFSSNWKDENYRRTVMACFVQVAYLLELDRQENRTAETSLAPNWWKPFKYKVTKTLVDERDGSIFGAVLEWDQSAALADFILMKPTSAPRAVLALRGTILKNQTIKRDIEDDFRFLAWESLKGSKRFNIALEALQSIVDNYGCSNVCMAGHSIGAGFALQVGKALAKQRKYVETHLFNPPSVSLSMSLKIIGEKAIIVWNRVAKMLPISVQTQSINEEKPSSGAMVGGKWVPNLYVNNSDYICCYYNDSGGISKKKNSSNSHEKVVEKIYVMSKGKQKFLEAHGLQQWWSDDSELQLSLQDSRLISRQLRSLYTVSPSGTATPIKAS
ncbi:hypothetical protein ACHQM5_004779 [Ranunculus cassubicifolius]